MVSIIIPVYNAEKTLERCVQSIINQSYKNWELLLIDDGSTDASSIICDRFASCNASIHVVHQANQGVSSARNTGMKLDKKLVKTLFLINKQYPKLRIEISSTGRYCYYDVSSHLKYELTISEALQYLKRIYESYKGHGIKNSAYLSLQLNFFTFVCRKDALGKATKWFNDLTVKEIFSECKNEMNLKHRFKFIMSTIPGVFKIYHTITGKWV